MFEIEFSCGRTMLHPPTAGSEDDGESIHAKDSVESRLGRGHPALSETLYETGTATDAFQFVPVSVCISAGSFGGV